ncbi:hypothetical protein VTJ04DRAFT_2725 [Mycothermus thermophilus]|uniref:uncharacterized protein n=1 Tax=Humicola insolens TaxID=85995 RepID=UPI0037444EEE
MSPGQKTNRRKPSQQVREKMPDGTSGCTYTPEAKWEERGSMVLNDPVFISDYVWGIKEHKNQYRYLVIGVNGGFLDTV